MINPTDPAFPCPSDIHGVEYKGIDIRTKLAATAPDAIPEWFCHSMEEDPKPAHMNPPFIHFSSSYHPSGDMISKWWDAENDQWYEGCSLLLTQQKKLGKEIIEYYEKFKIYTEQVAAWAKRDEVKRYFQWRVYFSDFLIKILNNEPLWPEKNSKKED